MVELHTGSIGNEGVNREKISSVSSFTGIGRSVIGDIGQTRSANNARRLVINFDCTNTMRTIEEENNRKKKKKRLRRIRLLANERTKKEIQLRVLLVHGNLLEKYRNEKYD